MFFCCKLILIKKYKKRKNKKENRKKNRMIYIGGYIMKNSIEKLYMEFYRIKSLGWIRSINNKVNGVGMTFEKMLGIESNELEIPDYNGIEIKTKRKTSNSYFGLFNCTLTGPYYHSVQHLKDNYGYPHRIYKKFKVLNNSVYCNRKNKIGSNYYFELNVNRKEKRIYLNVFNLRNNLMKESFYWDIDILEEKLYRKLKFLAIVKATTKRENGIEYFKFYSMNVYKLKNFKIFLDLIESGAIRINFKLNIITKGEKIGNIHDHGTSFDILEEDLNKLFEHW